MRLAALAGVTQSVISAYETGTREPSLVTLKRLIEATGLHLSIALDDAERSTPALAGSIQEQVLRSRDLIVQIAAKYGVQVIGFFGSVARGEDGPGSDIDLLIDISPDVGLFKLGRLEREIVDLLGLPVDLVPRSDLKPGVREEVLRELISL